MLICICNKGILGICLSLNLVLSWLSRISNSRDRSTFVGIPTFSNRLWVAMETMHFHKAHEDNFVSHSGVNEQFGTYENCPGGAR